MEEMCANCLKNTHLNKLFIQKFKKLINHLQSNSNKIIMKIQINTFPEKGCTSQLTEQQAADYV